jgi:hypothetical protein
MGDLVVYEPFQTKFCKIIMEKRVFTTPLTNLQVEILKLYTQELPEEDILTIRKMIAKYLLNKIRNEANKIGIERGYNEDTFKKLLNED